MKPIELPYQLPEDAKAFIMPIVANIKGLEVDEDMISYTTFDHERDTGFSNDYLDDFIYTYSPLQVGDEFYLYPSTLDRMYDYEENGLDTCMDFDELMSQKSEVKDNVCVSVEIKRVQDINKHEIKKCLGGNSFIIGDDFEQFKFNNKKFKELFQDAYEQNPYVFLYTFKNKE